MSVRKRILAGTSLALAVACGGSNGPTYNLTGTATSTGTVGSQSMTSPADAISTLVPQGNSTAGTILISTSGNLCAQSNAHTRLKNARSLAIVMGVQSGNNVAAPTLGTYTFFSQAGIATAQGNVATALFALSDAACTASTTQSTGGTMTLTRVDATGYTGTYTVNFATGTLSGTFNTGSCSALVGTGSTTCPP
jgi:hypothetical protein